MFDVCRKDTDGSIIVETVYAVRKSETTGYTFFLIYDERREDKWVWVNSFTYRPYKL